MRTPVLLAFGLSLLLTGVATAESGIKHLNQIPAADLNKVAAGSLPLAQTSLSFRYTNQWGIDQLWQLQGTTLRVAKSVHTAQFVDQARQTIASGGTVTGLQSQVLTLEYGNYDKYFQATLAPKDVQALYKTLASANVIGAECNVGCGQNSWTLELNISGKLTQKFDVNIAGNPTLEPSVHAVQDFLTAQEPQLAEISKADFVAAYIPTIPAGSPAF